ncbi:MFS transporter [Actinacidiphila sp. ITFR-21]|uniref:MFS transporter n=1 Tax=Actinacidiphila sp. ITFR-21 TaxID=3075199 RepID=UPI00288BCAE7|nr:MFS transporter [Streptomyces sp. ITFR-21]WNI18732.1 MFS transporter [Streptomyces sp. ITFR-21]
MHENERPHRGGSTADEVLPVDRHSLRRAVWGSVVGTTLEQFDLVIFGTASSLVFSTLIFPKASPTLGVIASFGVYGVGFLARPFGGLFFSALGERLGRKWVMMMTLFVMGTATACMGLLPTYAQAGILSPILLVLLRLLQGLGAGAEQSGGMTLLAETAPLGQRGRYASSVPVGSGLGIVLASAVWALIDLLLTHQQVLDWGWRVVFLSSVFVTLTGFVVRRKLRESPVFTALRQQRTAAQDAPLRGLVTVGRKPLVSVALIVIGQMTNAYVFLTFLGSYLLHHLDTDSGLVTRVLFAGAVAASIAPWLVGRLSDVIGRRPVGLVMTGIMVLFAPIAFLLLTTGSTFLTYVAVVIGSAVAVTGTNGLHSAFLPEIFGSRFRYAGTTMGREIAAVLGGAFAPLIASSLLAWASGSWWPIAVYMAAMAGISFVATLCTPETRDRDLLTEEDAFQERTRRAKQNLSDTPPWPAHPSRQRPLQY